MVVTPRLWSPYWKHANGGRLTDVVDIQLMCPEATCCQTIIHKQRFLTDATRQSGVTRFPVFGVELRHQGQQQWLVQTTEAYHVASMTIGAHPDLVQCWNGLCNETAEIRHLHSMLPSVMISVGTFVLERNRQRRAIDDPATISADLDLSWPTFVPWEFPEELPQEAEQFLHPEWLVIYKWLQAFQGPLDKPDGPWVVQRRSWVQLYADYLRNHRNGGPWRSPQCKLWLPLPSDQMIDGIFVKQSRWFSRYIITLAVRSWGRRCQLRSWNRTRLC